MRRGRRAASDRLSASAFFQTRGHATWMDFVANTWASQRKACLELSACPALNAGARQRLNPRRVGGEPSRGSGVDDVAVI